MLEQPELAKLKKGLSEILVFAYRFRYLNRIQIQSLLGHKHHHRINVWLNCLTREKYVKCYYSKKFASQPSVYSLGVTGRKYFKNNKDIGGIQPYLLNRVWKEYQYSPTFQKHCMFAADIYLSLVSLVEKNKAKLKYFTKVDLTGMKYMVRDIPDAYFAIEEGNGLKKGYFLDIIDDFPQREALRKRVWQYIRYYNFNYWQDSTGNPFPEIIIICADNRTKNYLSGYIKYTLRRRRIVITFHLSTWAEIRAQGIKKEALHKVETELGT